MVQKLKDQCSFKTIVKLPCQHFTSQNSFSSLLESKFWQLLGKFKMTVSVVLKCYNVFETSISINKSQLFLQDTENSHFNKQTFTLESLRTRLFPWLANRACLSSWKSLKRIAEKIWASAFDFQQCGMCDQQNLRSACAYAQTDQSLC